MGRQTCCEQREGLKKGPWSAEEDNKLLAFISAHGLACWREVPKLAGLRRCGKSCRLRWINYLRPDLKRGMLSAEEEDLIIQLHATHGNKWSRIAAQLPGRTDNEIKNCWNTRIKKKLQGRGIDPVTHKALFEMPGVTAPPNAQLQFTGVNAPPTLGHPSLNASAFYHYNRKPIRTLQEGVHTSPNSVMSPQVTTSLSHTPTTTNHEDELSVEYSAELLSHDHSIDSNLQASEFASENMFQGEPHMRFQSSQDGKDGLQNTAYMPYACPAPIAQEVDNSSLKLEDALYMHNPPHKLHIAPHMHYPPHMLQTASSILPNMLCMPTQLGASHSVQQVNQFRASQVSVQALQIKDGEDIPSRSIRIDESNDACKGSDFKVDVNKENHECAMTSTYARNAPPSLSPRSIKYLQDGGNSQPSDELCEPKNGDVTGTSVSSTLGGQWSGMPSDMLLSEEGDAELEPADSGMTPLPFLYEPSQALGHHNSAAACNTVNNMGQYWSSMDYLWGDPMPLTN